MFGSAGTERAGLVGVGLDTLPNAGRVLNEEFTTVCSFLTSYQSFKASNQLVLRVRNDVTRAPDVVCKGSWSDPVAGRNQW